MALPEQIPQQKHFYLNYIKSGLYMYIGARGSVVGWGTMLQTGRSPVQVPDKVDFFNPSNLTMALGVDSASNRNGKKRPARRADNLTAICEPIL
jgi:hypothetical protein